MHQIFLCLDEREKETQYHSELNETQLSRATISAEIQDEVMHFYQNVLGIPLETRERECEDIIHEGPVLSDEMQNQLDADLLLLG